MSIKPPVCSSRPTAANPSKKSLCLTLTVPDASRLHRKFLMHWGGMGRTLHIEVAREVLVALRWHRELALELLTVLKEQEIALKWLQTLRTRWHATWIKMASWAPMACKGWKLRVRSYAAVFLPSLIYPLSVSSHRHDQQPHLARTMGPHWWQLQSTSQRNRAWLW